MSVVLDYISQPADFATMKARGVAGAIVYVAPLGWGWTKDIKPAQIAEAEAAGFPLAQNFEAGTQDYLGGYAKGQQHGAAIEQAMKDRGYAESQPCYLSVDTNVGPSGFQTAGDYFRGARSATQHPLNFYGSNGLGEYLIAQGLVQVLWMSNSTAFYGNAFPTTNVAAQQHYGWGVVNLGGSYDVSTLLRTDWGQYPRPATSAPAPPIPTKGKKVEPFFYRVIDNPAVSPNSVWLSDGIVFTRHIGSPTTLRDWQWVLAANGVPNVGTIGTLPYAAHAELHQF